MNDNLRMKMVKTRICFFLSLVLIGSVLFAQESQQFELTGKLNPDPNQVQRFKRSVALIIGDGGTGAYKSVLTADISLLTYTIFRPANLANPPQQDGNAPRVIFPSVTKDDLSKIQGSVIYLLGEEFDIATPNGSDDFAKLTNVPVFMASYDFNNEVNETGNKGFGHYPATFRQPHGGDFGAAATAWLQWQLKDDTGAAKLFKGRPCGLESNPKWKVSKKNIE